MIYIYLSIYLMFSQRSNYISSSDEKIDRFSSCSTQVKYNSLTTITRFTLCLLRSCIITITRYFYLWFYFILFLIQCNIDCLCLFILNKYYWHHTAKMKTHVLLMFTNQSESQSGHHQLRFTRNYMVALRTWRRPPTSSLLLDWSCMRTRRRGLMFNCLITY